MSFVCVKYIELIFVGTTHSMSVISTAFDNDFFDEPLIESDRIESPCKRKCSKKKICLFLFRK